MLSGRSDGSQKQEKVCYSPQLETNWSQDIVSELPNSPYNLNSFRRKLNWINQIYNFISVVQGGPYPFKMSQVKILLYELLLIWFGAKAWSSLAYIIYICKLPLQRFHFNTTCLLSPTYSLRCSKSETGTKRVSGANFILLINNAICHFQECTVKMLQKLQRVQNATHSKI